MECPNCHKPIYNYKFRVIKENKKKIQYLCPECFSVIKESEKKIQEWQYALILVLVIPAFFFLTVFTGIYIQYLMPLYIAFFFLVFEIAFEKLKLENKIMNKKIEVHWLKRQLKITIIFLVIYYTIAGAYKVIQVKYVGGNYTITELEYLWTFLPALLLFVKIAKQVSDNEIAKKKIQKTLD